MSKKYSKKDNSPYVFKSRKAHVPLSITDKIPWTLKQKEIFRLIEDQNTKIVFISGPAGSGKSIMGVYAGLKELDKRKVSDLIYVRSVIESASQKLGFLPGSFEEKLSPYLRPLMDKLEELLPKSEADSLLKNEIVSGQPVNYLRGAHLSNKFIVADECFSDSVFLETDKGKIQLRNILASPNFYKVLSYNEKKDIFEYNKVLNTFDKGVRSLSTIKLDKRCKIKATNNHRFLTTRGWKKLKELKIGDGIISSAITHHSKRGLNEDQRSLVIGGLLGDFGHSKISLNSIRVGGTFGIAQKEYVEFKSELLNACLTYVPFNGYSQKPALHMRSNTFFWDFDGKHPKEYAIDNIDLKSLAISWQDDGSLSGSATLYSCADNEDMNEKLASRLNSMGYNCIATSCKNGEGRVYNLIRFRKEGSDKFFKDIVPYVHPSMSYKIPKEYHEHVGTYSWRGEFKNHSIRVVTSIDYNTSVEKVYDIEVENNHNFIVSLNKQGTGSQVVAHNCQNFTLSELITVITRIGEYSKFVFCGDPAQSDINGKSGFVELKTMFDNPESQEQGIYSVELDKTDIVRSEILKYIIEVLEKKS